MDTAICRLRQIGQAIQYRQERRAEAELNRIEWQTRALLVQLSGLSQSEKQHKALREFALAAHIRPPATESGPPRDLPPGLDFDPEAPFDPATFKGHIKPTEVVLARMGGLSRPKGG